MNAGDELTLHDGSASAEPQSQSVSAAPAEPKPSGTWFESELTIHGEGQPPRQDAQGLDDRDPPVYDY